MMYSEDATQNGPDAYKPIERAVKYLVKSKSPKKNERASVAAPDFPFDWSDIIDVQSNDTLSSGNLISHNMAELSSRCPHIDTSSNLMNWSPEARLYSVKDSTPGLYIISKALSMEAQLYWAEQSVYNFSRAEHTNITNLKRIHSEQELSEEKDQAAVKADSEIGDTPNETPRQPPGPPSVAAAVTSGEAAAILESQLSMPLQEFFKLRWSCLGYHYDWTARKYEKDLKTPFPSDLALFSKKLASAVGETIEPEAAIVNYYPLSGTMGGHLDDAEHNMNRPIVSISIGCSAVFLLGGRNRSIKPTAILVRSGDVVLMAGESRHCYHGIPALIPKDFSSYSNSTAPRAKINNSTTAIIETSATTSCNDSEGKCLFYNEELLSLQESKIRASPERQFVLDVLREGRININIRQVTINGDGQSELWCEKAGSGAASAAANIERKTET